MEQERIYLAVPYSEKDEAKSLGASWDSDMKRWYGSHSNEELLAKYRMVNLSVPFDKKDEAKKLGAMWDASRKCWYCANSNTKLIQRFPPGAAPAPATRKAGVPNTSAFSTFVAKPRTVIRPGRQSAPRVKPTIPGGGSGWGQIPTQTSFQWDEFED